MALPGQCGPVQAACRTPCARPAPLAPQGQQGVPSLAAPMPTPCPHRRPQLPLNDGLGLVGAERGHTVLCRKTAQEDRGQVSAGTGGLTTGVLSAQSTHTPPSVHLSRPPRPAYTCSLDSSSVNSGGNRSLRVENSWPSCTAPRGGRQGRRCGLGGQQGQAGRRRGPEQAAGTGRQAPAVRRAATASSQQGCHLAVSAACSQLGAATLP